MIPVAAPLGATCLGWGTLFRVWAPAAERVEVAIERSGAAAGFHVMEKSAGGYFSATVAGPGTGDLYRYRIDGEKLLPDPASRFQPQGVHGPSEIVNPAAFAWTDADWKGVDRHSLVLYELHTGAFSPEGTFAGAARRLPYLKDLGVTAIELMPVADFAGDWNWGYDGVALFAPARCYGTPDDLRRLVDTAHGFGLAVFLDVVYNHLGPDGAYHESFSRAYVSREHRSPWGAALNFDGPQSSAVRDHFIENAVRWVDEYHFDGLRLDATHAIIDDSPRHIIASIASAVRATAAQTGRTVHVIAEDSRNLARMVQPESEDGWGMDGVWSDDFHHQVRSALAGDRDGYFQDFDGAAASIADTARKGWFFCGQHSPYFEGNRGTDPSGVDYSRFVFFIQNHDQVGNRAMGDRLNHALDPAVWRAISTLFLLLPETPLLFMGQEWAASTPFRFFTNHHGELGKRVTEGRRREFKHFREFADPKNRKRIPDPQDAATFEASRLRWEEMDREPHRSMLRLVTRLLVIRKSEPEFHGALRSGELNIEALDPDTLAFWRYSTTGVALVVARLRGAGDVTMPENRRSPALSWTPLISTEDSAFAADSAPIEQLGPPLAFRFTRPGAIVVRAGATHGGMKIRAGFMP